MDQQGASYPNDTIYQKIEIFGLSKETNKWLKEHNVHYIIELCMLNESSLLNEMKASNVQLRIIKQRLKEYGLYLGMNVKGLHTRFRNYWVSDSIRYYPNNIIGLLNYLKNHATEREDKCQ